MIILDGKKTSKQIKEKIKKKLEKEKIAPLLVVIRVGDDKASETYVNQKNKFCNEVGIKFKEMHLDSHVTEQILIDTITSLNNDSSVSGILVQLPLPKHLNTYKIINTITPDKDVDGLTDINKCRRLNDRPGIIPCTPKGIIYLLKEYKIPISGKHVVVIGRSDLVGRPLLDLLLKENATVTMCHSKTSNLKNHTSNADILISATGKKGLITNDMIKENAVVIDAGITKYEGKIYGDVSQEDLTHPAYLTPVPGGVGPMTVAMLLENVLECYQKNI